MSYTKILNQFFLVPKKSLPIFFPLLFLFFENASSVRTFLKIIATDLFISGTDFEIGNVQNEFLKETSKYENVNSLSECGSLCSAKSTICKAFQLKNLDCILFKPTSYQGSLSGSESTVHLLENLLTCDENSEDRKYKIEKFGNLNAISRNFTLLRGVNFKISLAVGSSNRIRLYTNRMFTTESYWRIPGKVLSSHPLIE